MKILDKLLCAVFGHNWMIAGSAWADSFPHLADSHPDITTHATKYYRCIDCGKVKP